jgi:hypothetical protein
MEGALIIAILRSLPNVEKLFMVIWNFNNAISDCQAQDKVIMPKLKQLELLIDDNTSSLGNVFNLLSENSITHLEITGDYWGGLKSLMERQAKSVVNLKLNYRLIKSPEFFQEMKLKTFAVTDVYEDYNDDFDAEEFNTDLLKVVIDHPELEGIKVGEWFETRSDVAKALLKMKRLKSISLNVTDENWNEVLHAIGRSSNNVSKIFQNLQKSKISNQI